MRPIVLMSFLVVISFPVRTLAGDIYGTLWEDGKKVGPGVPVDIFCGMAGNHGQTNKQGTYRMFVPVSSTRKNRRSCVNTMTCRRAASATKQIASALLARSAGNVWTISSSSTSVACTAL